VNAYLDNLPAIAPELWLVATACAVLVLDLVLRGRDSRIIGWLTLGGLAVTTGLLLMQWRELGTTASRTVFGMVRIDLFGTFFKLFTTGSLAFVSLMVLFDRRERRHGIGEYYFLLLGAGIGVFFMVSTTNLLLMMLGLELLSLASYALAGFHKGDRRSAEASMKYVVFGGLSAGIMLYGISLLYGITGSIDLVAIGASQAGGLAEQFAQSPLPIAIAVVLVLAGFAYKISAVPFHFWTPDVYQGAPTPVTTFLAVASKAAGFAALARFLGALFLSPETSSVALAYGKRVGLLLAILSAVTMTLGNLSALRQTSMKRMLAYSSIAHAGYVLMGLAAMSVAGFEAAIFYLAAYYLMNLGAFAFVLYFEGLTGSDDIAGLRGMGSRTIAISIAMVVFLVSLTGLPPTVGFYGKYQLFLECLDSDLAWLVVIAALNSVISLFYYFRIAKALFLSEPSRAPAPGQAFFAGALGLLAIGTVAFGLFMGPLLEWTELSASSLGLR
jgi:NADH-quinone oxidoreductase subunit N